MAILGDIHRHHISERVSCQSQRLCCAETLLLLQIQVLVLVFIQKEGSDVAKIVINNRMVSHFNNHMKIKFRPE